MTSEQQQSLFFGSQGWSLHRFDCIYFSFFSLLAEHWNGIIQKLVVKKQLLLSPEVTTEQKCCRLRSFFSLITKPWSGFLGRTFHIRYWRIAIPIIWHSFLHKCTPAVRKIIMPKFGDIWYRKHIFICRGLGRLPPAGFGKEMLY